jgi:hypothetical protein
MRAAASTPPFGGSCGLRLDGIGEELFTVNNLPVNRNDWRQFHSRPVLFDLPYHIKPRSKRFQFPMIVFKAHRPNKTYLVLRDGNVHRLYAHVALLASLQPTNARLNADNETLVRCHSFVRRHSSTSFRANNTIMFCFRGRRRTNRWTRAAGA